MGKVLDHFKVMLSGDATGLQKELRRTSKNFQQTGKDLQRMGLGFSVGVTAPFVALSAKFVGAASDAEEMNSKFDVVFGKNAQAVDKWAEAYGNKVGRATTEIKDMSAGLQDLLVPMGLQTDTALNMSKNFSALAIDVASFNNAQDADVMRDFKSALIGNHETVQKYGVVINESIIKQKLAEMGMEGLTGKALAQAKVMARAKLIMEGTTAAHGDAARTSGSYANQTKALSAEFTEMSETLGQTLMPIARDLVTWARDAISWFKDLGAENQKTVLIFGAVAAAIGPVLLTLGAMSTGVGAVVSAFSGLAGILGSVTAIFPVVGTVIAAILSPIGLAAAAVVGLGAIFWNFRDEIGEALAPVGEFFHKAIVVPVDEAISFSWRMLASFVSAVADKLGSVAGYFGFEGIKEELSGYQTALNDFAEGTGPIAEKAVMAAGGAAMKMSESILAKITDLTDQAKAKMSEVYDGSGLETFMGDSGEDAGDDDKDAQAQAEVDREAQKTEQIKGYQLGLNDFFKKSNKQKKADDATTWGGLLGNAALGSKKLAKVQKAGAIGQVLMNQGKALSEAVASAPFPMNVPAIAFATAQSAVALAQVKGQFHSGIDNVPETGTYLLKRGERVVDDRLNGDLTRYLSGAKGNQGPAVGGPTINLTIGDNADPDAVYANRAVIENTIRDIYADFGLADPLGA